MLVESGKKRRQTILTSMMPLGKQREARPQQPSLRPSHARFTKSALRALARHKLRQARRFARSRTFALYSAATKPRLGQLPLLQRQGFPYRCRLVPKEWQRQIVSTCEYASASLAARARAARGTDGYKPQGHDEVSASVGGRAHGTTSRYFLRLHTLLY